VASAVALIIQVDKANQSVVLQWPLDEVARRGPRRCSVYTAMQRPRGVAAWGLPCGAQAELKGALLDPDRIAAHGFHAQTVLYVTQQSAHILHALPNVRPRQACAVRSRAAAPPIRCGWRSAAEPAVWY
jgi:hypothetical protein